MNSSSSSSILNNIHKMEFYFEEKTGKQPTKMKICPQAYQMIIQALPLWAIPSVLKNEQYVSFSGMTLMVDTKIDGIELE